VFLVGQRQRQIGDDQLAFSLQGGVQRNVQSGGLGQVDPDLDVLVVLQFEHRRAGGDHHVRLDQTPRDDAVEGRMQRAVADVASGTVTCHARRHHVGLQRFDRRRRENPFGQQGALASQVRLQLTQPRFGLA